MPDIKFGIDSSGAQEGARKFEEAAGKIISQADKIIEAATRASEAMKALSAIPVPTGVAAIPAAPAAPPPVAAPAAAAIPGSAATGAPVGPTVDVDAINRGVTAIEALTRSVAALIDRLSQVRSASSQAAGGLQESTTSVAALTQAEAQLGAETATLNRIQDQVFPSVARNTAAWEAYANQHRETLVLEQQLAAETRVIDGLMNSAAASVTRSATAWETYANANRETLTLEKQLGAETRVIEGLIGKLGSSLGATNAQWETFQGQIRETGTLFELFVADEQRALQVMQAVTAATTQQGAALERLRTAASKRVQTGLPAVVPDLSTTPALMEAFEKGATKVGNNSEIAAKKVLPLVESLNRVGSVAVIAAGPLSGIGSRFVALGALMGTFGGQMGATIGGLALLGTALGKSVQMAAEFEQAMAEVAKTTPLTDSAVKLLGEDLLAMAPKLGQSAAALAKITSQGAQLGVEGSENLREFTRVIAETAVATNLTADQAAEGFARLANVTGEPIANIDEMSSALVLLGNKSAATESQILDLSTEIGKAGGVFGVSAEKALAFSAAMASAGVHAEAGGTAFGRLAGELDKVAREGGAKLQRLSEIMGEPTAKIANTIRTDMGGAIQQFLNALSVLQSEGGSAAAVLEEFGISGERGAKAIRPMVDNIRLLNEAVAQSAQQFADPTARMKEFERFSATLTQAFARLTAAVNTFGVELGSTSVPGITLMINALTELVTTAGQASEVVGILGTALAGLSIGAAVGGALSLLGASLGPLPAQIGLVVLATVASVDAFYRWKEGVKAAALAAQEAEKDFEGIGKGIRAANDVLKDLSKAKVLGPDVMERLKEARDDLVRMRAAGLDTGDGLNYLNGILKEVKDGLEKAAVAGNQDLIRSEKVDEATKKLQQFAETTRELRVVLADMETATIGGGIEFTGADLVKARDMMSGLTEAEKKNVETTITAKAETSELALALDKLGKAATGSTRGINAQDAAVAKAIAHQRELTDVLSAFTTAQDALNKGFAEAAVQSAALASGQGRLAPAVANVVGQLALAAEGGALVGESLQNLSAAALRMQADFEKLAIQKAMNEGAEGVRNLADQARLLGPSFDTAGGKAQLFSQILMKLRADGVDWATAMQTAIAAVGDSFANLRVESVMSKLAESTRKATEANNAFNTSLSQPEQNLTIMTARVKDLEAAITSLIDQGFSATDAPVAKMTSELNNLKNTVGALGPAVETAKKNVADMNAATRAGGGAGLQGLQEQSAAIGQATTQALSQQEQFANFSTRAMQGLASGALVVNKAVQDATGRTELVTKGAMESWNKAQAAIGALGAKIAPTKEAPMGGTALIQPFLDPGAKATVQAELTGMLTPQKLYIGTYVDMPTMEKANEEIRAFVQEPGRTIIMGVGLQQDWQTSLNNEIQRGIDEKGQPTFSMTPTADAAATKKMVDDIKLGVGEGGQPELTMKPKVDPKTLAESLDQTVKDLTTTGEPPKFPLTAALDDAEAQQKRLLNELSQPQPVVPLDVKLADKATADKLFIQVNEALKDKAAKAKLEFDFEKAIENIQGEIQKRFTETPLKIPVTLDPGEDAATKLAEQFKDKPISLPISPLIDEKTVETLNENLLKLTADNPVQMPVSVDAAKFVESITKSLADIAEKPKIPLEADLEKLKTTIKDLVLEQKTIEVLADTTLFWDAIAKIPEPVARRTVQVEAQISSSPALPATEWVRNYFPKLMDELEAHKPTITARFKREEQPSPLPPIPVTAELTRPAGGDQGELKDLLERLVRENEKQSEIQERSARDGRARTAIAATNMGANVKSAEASTATAKSLGPGLGPTSIRKSERTLRITSGKRGVTVTSR